MSPRAVPKPAEPWYTVAEVAARYKVSKNRVYEWIYAGCLHSTRLPARGDGPGVHRIEQADLERFEAACRDAGAA